MLLLSDEEMDAFYGLGLVKGMAQGLQIRAEMKDALDPDELHNAGEKLLEAAAKIDAHLKSEDRS